MFEIEKNIEIPKECRGRPPIWPFASMEIGESFAVPIEDGKKARLAANAYKITSKTGWSYTSRASDGHMRIWRTS